MRAGHRAKSDKRQKHCSLTGDDGVVMNCSIMEFAQRGLEAVAHEPSQPSTSSVLMIGERA